MKSSLCLTWSLLVGLFLLTSNAEAARATTLILGKSKPEPKIDTPPTGEEEAAVSPSTDSQLGNETAGAGNVTKLTGVPQIDYIYDPNLPRELNGYNLTDYPFYNSVPEDIDFKCDGLHDGFYASIPHKCQVYHHCLFGTRYDFLCANYTAFDQKTFICHFASEVDCKNSPKYFKRNEALYKAASTTTVAPPVPAVLTARRPSDGGRRRRPPGGRRRKPVYDYYDDYEESAEQDYYDDGPSGYKRKRPRPHNRDGADSSDDSRVEEEEDKSSPPPSGPNKSLYDRPRIAPKIRRPVPINERDKYDYGTDSRAILPKETAPERDKTRHESRDSDNRKVNHRPLESAVQGSGKKTESDDDREKEPSRDDYDSDRDRERERVRDKGHGRDEYDSDRERDRGRGDEYESDRERERERERSRDRDRDLDRPYRRPPKKRRRPDEEDDYEYEDVRRWRNRNRQRYDEYDDDYDYDDRPYRPRTRDSDYRSREHDYDRDKGYRNRESDYDRPRNRDRIRDDKPLRNRDDKPRWEDERPSRSRDEDRPHRNRDSDDEYYRGDDDRPGRVKPKTPYRSDGKSDKSTRTRDREPERYYSEVETKKSSVREEDYEEEFEPKSKAPAYESKGRQPLRQEQGRNQERIRDDDDVPTERPYRGKESTERGVRGRPEPALEEPKSDEPVRLRATERSPVRGRTGSVQKLKSPEPTEGPEEEEERQPRPVRPQPEQSAVRKAGGSKRVYYGRPSQTTEPASDYLRRGSLPAEPKFQEQTPEPTEVPRHDVTRPRDDVTRPNPPQTERVQEETTRAEQAEAAPATSKPDPAAAAAAAAPEAVPKFRVPFDDEASEELAPQAPKFQLSSRRRPFLPSRGGNPNLPRGLLPVGSKALPVPRGFQKSDEEVRKDGLEAQAKQKKMPPSIEFRTRLTASIGVQPSMLSSALYDQTPVQLTSPGQQYLTYQDFRPLTPQHPPPRPPHEYVPGEKSNPVRSAYADSSIVHASSTEAKDSLRQRPIQVPHAKVPIALTQQPQQLGPQTFYSDNPKFKTTVTIPERYVQKPTAPTLNYHTATHLPVYQQGLPSSFGANPRPDTTPKTYFLAKGNENHKPLIIKFPPPNKENLDGTDEYDVSLNDALQPISTLHPRNAPTGVFLSNAQRAPQQTTAFKRRVHHMVPAFSEQEDFPERMTVLKRVRIETRSATHAKSALVHRPEASSLQQRYALPPVNLATKSPPRSNIYAILS